MEIELGLMDNTAKKGGRDFEFSLQDDVGEAEFLLFNLV